MIARTESKVVADRHSLPEPEPAKGRARRASLSLSAPRSISLPPSQRAFAARPSDGFSRPSRGGVPPRRRNGSRNPNKRDGGGEEIDKKESSS